MDTYLGEAERLKAIEEQEYRSDPEYFLKTHKENIHKFAKIISDLNARNFIESNPELVHEAVEAFLITHAVDLAVEDNKHFKTVARRCLEVKQCFFFFFWFFCLN